ncbi:ATP synthase F1 subunit delta [Sodaliphilus sp.]|uniref:ATP synthase F1 subunit delta n=1 Tax=Sodaliphilus sp. TaxID=2815818 RepID=UPI0038908248
MNDGLIPSRYAKALYKLSIETGECDEIYEQMRALSGRNTAIDELKRVMRNPYIPNEDKGRVMLLAAGAKPGSSLEKFIMLIIRNNRAEFLRKIALSYVALYREKHNIAEVIVTTAAQLSEKEMQAIIDVVKKQLQGYTFEVVSEINPDLIGGFTVQVGDVLLDASVKNELKNLRLKLLS